jgi:hypothetical protein
MPRTTRPEEVHGQVVFDTWSRSSLGPKDFPAAILVPFGLVTEDPDSFLCRLHNADSEVVLAAVDAARTNLSRTRPSEADFQDAIGRRGSTGL